jgi:hypothetical protein
LSKKEALVLRVDQPPAGRLPVFLIAFGTILLLVISSACGSPTWSGNQPAQPTPLTAKTTSSAVPVLLYNGTGTSANDVTAVESILSNLTLKYSTANTGQMEAMAESTLSSFKLLIVPGGNSITIGNNLSHAATTKIHDAVINDGLHYLGICAGAFFGGYSIHNGLNLTDGVWFNFYADEFKGIHKEVVTLSFPNSPKMDMYWQDGPQLSSGGDIISKYPDGTPSIVERQSGKGWVILSGVHPEAPASWRTGMPFKTPLATDLAYAATLVTSALNGTSLPHY